ncbi:hypothetical protein KKF55_03855 [Patescibacteria group bacterium]|nr:hypothetical protein [Patescibacteria group bacterium]
MSTVDSVAKRRSEGGSDTQPQNMGEEACIHPILKAPPTNRTTAVM